MSIEQNRALSHRMVEEFINQRDLTAADEILSPNMIDHEELPPDVPEGSEGVKVMFNKLFDAFTDFQATIEHLIAEDDMVAIHMLWTGIHKDEFMGIPPTGKQIAINAIDLLRVSDGMFVEHWGVTDMMALVEQLGVGP